MGRWDGGRKGSKKRGGGRRGVGTGGYKRLRDDCTTAQKAAEGGIPA